MQPQGAPSQKVAIPGSNMSSRSPAQGRRRQVTVSTNLALALHMLDGASAFSMPTSMVPAFRS